MSFTPYMDHNGGLRYRSFEQYLQTLDIRQWYISERRDFVIRTKNSEGAWCISEMEVSYLSGVWDTTDSGREWKDPVGWRTWALRHPHLRVDVLPQLIGEPMPRMMLPLCYEFIKWRLVNGV